MYSVTQTVHILLQSVFRLKSLASWLHCTRQSLLYFRCTCWSARSSTPIYLLSGDTDTHVNSLMSRNLHSHMDHSDGSSSRQRRDSAALWSRTAASFSTKLQCVWFVVMWIRNLTTYLPQYRISEATRRNRYRRAHTRRCRASHLVCRFTIAWNTPVV